MANYALLRNLDVKRLLVWAIFIGFMVAVEAAFAGGGKSMGDMAKSMTTSLGEVGKMITAASYVGGLGFVIGALMKFKQHKDNPTQVPLGTPMTLLVMAIALLFLPTLLEFSSTTIFGGKATTAGPGGTTI